MAPRIETDPSWMAEHIMRQQREITAANHSAESALHQAELGRQSQASHEELCALRYEMINTHITGQGAKFTNVFAKLDKLTGVVYIGVGIWVGLPVIAGAIFGILRLMSVVKGG